MTRDPFALVRLHVEGELSPARLAELISPVLRLPDLLAYYSPNEYEILLASTTPEQADEMTRELWTVLHGAGFTCRTGTAHYPRDGRTPEALVGVTSQRVRGAQDERSPAGDRVTYDPVMQRVQLLADRAAQGTINVLIVGENGVGKEILAEGIHRRSARADKPFLCINCAAFSEQLFESELFGHERGAFTGANEAKPGLLETAPGGTVLLDEIGEMPASLQVKLLRVLETRLVTRVGGLKARPIDVRFLAATNRNLENEVASGRFRRDLYFRLNGMTLHIPPLRARPGEILQLAAIFLQQFSRQQRRRPPEIEEDAQRLLLEHPWPGNIRELRNMMERASLLCAGEPVRPEHLMLETVAADAEPWRTEWAANNGTPSDSHSSGIGASAPLAGRPTPPMPLPAEGAPAADADAEREHILRTLAQCGGNQSRAAKALGMARSTLVLRLNSYQIPRPPK